MNGHVSSFLFFPRKYAFTFPAYCLLRSRPFFLEGLGVQESKQEVTNIFYPFTFMFFRPQNYFASLLKRERKQEITKVVSL